MSAPTLQEDIDRGLAITKQMEKLKEELKQIKARVDEAALAGEQIPLEDAERDGMQYLACGSEKVVPVIVTADFLTQSFKEGSKMHKVMLALCGRSLGELYLPETTFATAFDDGKAFRRQARAMFSDKAELIINAATKRDKSGMPVNAIKIEWDRARPLLGAPRK